MLMSINFGFPHPHITSLYTNTVMTCLDQFLASLRVSSSKQGGRNTTLVIVDDNPKAPTPSSTLDGSSMPTRPRERAMSLPPHSSSRWSPIGPQSRPSLSAAWKSHNGRSRWQDISAVGEERCHHSRYQSISVPTRSKDTSPESVASSSSKRCSIAADSNSSCHRGQFLSKDLPPSLRALPY